jgi:hypothetical protein
VTSPTALDGCIWACAEDRIDEHADRLEAIFDIIVPAVDAGGLAMRSSSESGIHVIAHDDAGAEPGVWGIVAAVDDVPASRERFPAVRCDESARRVHDALAKRGVLFAGSFLGVNVYLSARPRSAGSDLLSRPTRPKPYPYLFVWVVQPENLDGHAGQLAALLGADFERVTIPGGRVAISWDSGFELIAPEPRELHLVDGKLDETTTDPHHEHVRGHGDGPWSIVLRVADIEAFRERVARLGYDPSPLLQDADPVVRRDWYRSWTRKVVEQREIRLPGFLGLRLMAGEVTYRVDQSGPLTDAS